MGYRPERLVCVTVNRMSLARIAVSPQQKASHEFVTAPTKVREVIFDGAGNEFLRTCEFVSKLSPSIARWAKMRHARNRYTLGQEKLRPFLHVFFF